MKMMEGTRRGIPAATVVLVASLAFSGCSPRESAPEEAAVVWEDIERQLTTEEGSSTTREMYDAADIDERAISVSVAGLEHGERAAAIVNAVFEGTGADDFRAASKGVVNGEHIVSLELGNPWPWDETFVPRQLESASAVVCGAATANGMDIGLEDPIAWDLVEARELAGDEANELRRQVVFECIGWLATEIETTDRGTAELVVPIE